MKLQTRLFVNQQEVKLADHKVSLKLSLGGRAIFVFSAEQPPEARQPVAFDVGYNGKLNRWFDGYIETVQPAESGHHKIMVKENAGILSQRWAVSLEHPSLRDVTDKLTKLTGLIISLPEDVDYTDRKIPNFVSKGDGYQLMASLGRAFAVPDFVWYQQGDGSVYVGSWADCHFGQREFSVPPELSQRQMADSMTFSPFPVFRPGARVNGKRVTRLELHGDEMTAYWQATESPISPKTRETLNQFPELAAGYHLPIFGRVEAVRDSSQSGQPADPFRPRYAVDVQVLDENMQPDKDVPVYRSVPLPVHMSGHESGLIAYPLEGTVVEIAFAYGRNDRPIIRGIYGRDYALPKIEPGEQLQQQREGVSRRIDAAGNITDTTDQQYNRNAFKLNDQADSFQGQFGKHQLTIDEHSTEAITGKKLIEALGAINLLAGDDLVLGSLGNMQIATAGDLVQVIGQLRDVVIALDDKLTVMKDRIHTIEGNDQLTISKDLIIKAKNIIEDADTIKLNGGKGVCTGATICPFTGKPHVDVSTTVFAGK
ncbi:hypothetical protein [Photobacterium halotolerans]|uniref:Gp5/Type VI secretion system Vgr protein OB-fold domain-containing protein n=1 Tax=Photobacterium halotolerans TaxID=265726 RepID=A0A0F5VGS6_9GAMM|nr:hypothetical protein [Photobacterium halotolerans]KKD01376.1 hypothetical protein KY46_00650 [Photobacterium halotolerans]